ncbi:MAG: NADH:flavin oxidoreductase [Synergistaceae bacterium]|jgi:2,4-dienoyl-CoA reductase-like NADH-dependent reductase (Old Yellow Enzyme family)|nr:NADH:flavin oxidoreductase [Synergistaceae bacterium]
MKSLFDATEIGGMSLKNRFIRAAVADKTADGSIDDEVVGLYRALARGGVGTIVTGYTLVDDAEKMLPIAAFYDDSFLDGHRRLTEAVHGHNGNIVLQLVYVGSYVAAKDVSGVIALAPSAVPNLISGTMAREASAKELESIRQKFAQAALRAKEAGYDGVEIHAAHGFLLSQFMTPYYNRRTDLYGGAAENRSRMLLETYDAVRGAVGPNFSIWAKINSTDGIDGGLTLEDCLYLCKNLTQHGIDAIEVSGKWFSFPIEARAYFEDPARKIAEENAVAVILTGGNRDCKEMTRLLNDSGIGYFGMARPFMKEPDLIRRFQKEMSEP